MDQVSYGYERTPLSRRLADYYWDVVALHGDDPAVGACLVCRVSRCQDWRHASEKLAMAGEGTLPVSPTAGASAHVPAWFAPLGEGDVVQIADRQGSGDADVMTFRIAVVHGTLYLDDGPYALVDVVLMSEEGDGEPQYAQIRTADILDVSEFAGPEKAA